MRKFHRQMGLLNGALTFLGLFGAYFVVCLFFCWLAFVFGENQCDRRAKISEGGCCCPWRYPPKSTVVSWKPEVLELGCVFTPQFKWSWVSRIKSTWRIKSFFQNSRREFKEGQKKKKKKIEKKEEEFKSTRRILYYIQNSRREFEVSTSRKEDKRKKLKKIDFYYSS